jgi:chromosomal replication initiation ATPase DnaA
MNTVPDAAHVDPAKPAITAGLRGLLASMARDHGLTPQDLLRRDRRRPIVIARQAFMWRCRQVRRPDGRRRYSLPQIAAALGGIHHTTVMHGVRAHAARLDR